MITVYNYEQLGTADYGWLKAKHHFSFGHYYDPHRVGFGALRVINDDAIQPDAGFETHPHRNMEIITYVRTGAITHRDNQGNVGRTEAGDVQVMSAGRGIFHSEYNLEGTETTLYQIWITPNRLNTEPSWKTHHFPRHNSQGALELLVSGDGQAPLSIQQDAYIYAGKLSAGQHIEHHLKHQAYVLVSEGEISIDNHRIKKGDGAEINNLKTVELIADRNSDVLIIDVPTAA